MQLAASNGNSLDLDIVGYAYPDSTNEDDANWLTIRIAATNRRGSWQAHDPSLQTWEAEVLAEWLEVLSEGHRLADPDFLEANLIFNFVEHVGDHIRLRIWFNNEFKPPWVTQHLCVADDVSVDLSVPVADLEAAAESLRADLRRFPRRAVPVGP